MTAIQLNLNDTIRFKMLPRGRKLYEAYWRSANMEPPEVKTDADGWCEDQIWHFALIYGPGMSMGFDPPVETAVEIVLKA